MKGNARASDSWDERHVQFPRLFLFNDIFIAFQGNGSIRGDSIDYMRILVVSDDLDMVTRITFRSLAERYGHQIAIAGPGEESDGVMEGLKTRPIKSKFSLKAIKDLRRYIKESGYDVVFAPSTSGLSNALVASAGTNAAVVGYRGTQHRVHRSDPTNYMALLNPRVAHIICETSDIKSYLEGFIPVGKLSWHSKPYSIDWVRDAIADPKRIPYGKEGLRCVYVGMTKERPYKGLDILIEAMRKLESHGVTLTVVGSADEQLMADAPGNVYFLGPRADAVGFMPPHDVFILPSLRDASPRVLREAQACGLPCVVTDIPGARNLIINHETGLLVSPADPHSIADAVEKLLGDPDNRRRMGENAIRNIEENYRPEEYVDYFHRIFSEIKFISNNY